MKIEKYHLSLAGEYRVCSELLKRGIFATVTLGNMKSADVIAVGSSGRAAIIEVKTSQSNRFVTGFYQKHKTADAQHPAFWVLYTVKESRGSDMERFFVLTHEEMAEAQASRNHPGEQLEYAERVRRVSKGVDNLVIATVEAHENAWDKIVRWCVEPAAA